MFKAERWWFTCSFKKKKHLFITPLREGSVMWEAYLRQQTAKWNLSRTLCTNINHSNNKKMGAPLELISICKWTNNVLCTAHRYLRCPFININLPAKASSRVIFLCRHSCVCQAKVIWETSGPNTSFTPDSTFGRTCSVASAGGLWAPTWCAMWKPRWWWVAGRTRWWWERASLTDSSPGAGKRLTGRSRWPRWQRATRRRIHTWPRWSSSTDGTLPPERGSKNSSKVGKRNEGFF